MIRRPLNPFETSTVFRPLYKQPMMNLGFYMGDDDCLDQTIKHHISSKTTREKAMKERYISLSFIALFHLFNALLI